MNTRKIAVNKKIKRFFRFLEELSWLTESYSDIDLKSATKLVDEILSYKGQTFSIEKFDQIGSNKQFLVGVLPRLFIDHMLFPTNNDIVQFANSVLSLQIPGHEKKSRYDIIGRVVCETNNLDDGALEILVKALNQLIQDKQLLENLIDKRRKEKENFSWNRVIQELSSGNK